jgi:hypothetical protein
MNIYLITQTKDLSFCSYASAVVISDSESKAALIHPDASMRGINILEWEYNSVWAKSPDYVKVKYLGKLESSDYKEGDVISASLNSL